MEDAKAKEVQDKKKRIYTPAKKKQQQKGRVKVVGECHVASHRMQSQHILAPEPPQEETVDERRAAEERLDPRPQAAPAPLAGAGTAVVAVARARARVHAPRARDPAAAIFGAYAPKCGAHAVHPAHGR